MMLAADHYLPVDDLLIPTGEIRPVAGTAFDFRVMAPMKRFEAGRQVAYDHNFCFSGERTAKRSVGLVRSQQSGVVMELRTTEPGVQLYTGAKLTVPVPGLDGRRYGAFAGFCLETQVWPTPSTRPVSRGRAAAGRDPATGNGLRVFQELRQEVAPDSADGQVRGHRPLQRDRFSGEILFRCRLFSGLFILAIAGRTQ